MKIAIPARDGQVDDHFGHCDHFVVYLVEEGAVKRAERLDSPVGCGCKSDIAATLKELGVELLLAGNMGQGAVGKLAEQGIRVVRGCAGPLDAVLADWLAGKIKDAGLVCLGHDGHLCAH